MFEMFWIRLRTLYCYIMVKLLQKRLYTYTFAINKCFVPVLRFIWKPVICFAQKNRWLVSIWNATLGWNELIEYLLSWWSGNRTSIPDLQIDELFIVLKRNHTSFSCTRFAFDFEYLMETAFAYLKALYIWVKADQRKFSGLTFS